MRLAGNHSSPSSAVGGRGVPARRRPPGRGRASRCGAAARRAIGRRRRSWPSVVPARSWARELGAAGRRELVACDQLVQQFAPSALLGVGGRSALGQDLQGAVRGRPARRGAARAAGSGCACPPRGRRRSPCRSPRGSARRFSRSSVIWKATPRCRPKASSAPAARVAAPAAMRADLQWRDERVPAGLLVDHRRGSRRRRAARRWTGSSPSSMRLALDRLPGHPGDRPQDAQRRPEADQLDVVEQRLQRERQHRVADVDRDRNAVVDVQRGPAAAHHRLVLDVVVDEEGVVVELQRGRGRQDGLDAAAEPPACGDAQRRAQAFPSRSG